MFWLLNRLRRKERNPEERNTMENILMMIVGVQSFQSPANDNDAR